MELYECLGVPAFASQEQIRAAYEQKIALLRSSRWRTLLCQMLQLTYPYDYAFQILSDEASRRRYDLEPAVYDRATLNYFGF